LESCHHRSDLLLHGSCCCCHCALPAFDACITRCITTILVVVACLSAACNPTPLLLLHLAAEHWGLHACCSDQVLALSWVLQMIIPCICTSNLRLLLSQGQWE
jgi:hypothetical protein